MTHLLFLHGALGSKLQFLSLMERLKEQYTCHAINFAGHGGELIPAGGLTFDTFSNNILQYLDANDVKEVDLFGFSMGGYAAMYFAKHHPERVRKIFTLNVKFNWDPITTAKETGLLDPEKMLEKVPVFANNLMVLHGLNIWKKLLNSTSEMMKKLSETVLLSEDEIKSIQQEVMLAVGDQDKTSSIRETEHVFKLLPKASMLVLPGTAHPFEFISTERLAFEITNFFNSSK